MKALFFKPRAWRVFVFFSGAFAAVIVPVGTILLLGFLGPPPYLLEGDKLTTEWLGKPTSVRGVTVRATKYGSADEAGQAAKDLQAGIPIDSIVKTLNALRYTRKDNGLDGLVLPIGEAVIQLEGSDPDQIDRALESLPFVKQNPRKNLIYVLLTEHLEGFFWGLGIWVILFAVALGRGGSWAARIEGDKTAVPCSAEALQKRLLEINHLDVPVAIKEKRPGYLIAEWRLTDARWTSLFETGGLQIAHSIRMKFDEAEHVVRAIDVSKRIRWSAGIPRAAFSFSFFRGITFYRVEAGASYGLFLKDGRWSVGPAYQYKFSLNELKKPVVEAIVLSGWTFKSVVTFFRLIGG